MKIEIKVPQLPESVTEATLVTWHKKVGDAVKRDENLIDLETDKVVLELPAPDNGVLLEIIANNGDVVKSGQVIAYFDTQAVASDVSKNTTATSAVVKDNIQTINNSNELPKTSKLETNDSIVMPSAKKIAAENNVDLTKIEGSGRDGRILKEDVMNNTTTQNAASLKNQKLEERVPMSRLRKRVAERLLQSQQENAILTTFNEVNMYSVMNLRTKYKELFEKKYNVKLGFMSFFVKAVIHALKQYPLLNASIDNDDIIYHGYFDIGIAVSSPRGLVVPILRDVASLTMAQIEQQIADFGKRAKDGKLELDELTGGTFSITNGGTFGSMLSTPIINPPQSAILGMHAIKERAVVENGQIVIRPVMYLALSYDHRLIDGKDAVSALVAIKDALEDPNRFLLGL